MNVNKRIIASTLVIMALGIVHAWTANPPQGITKVVLGGYVLMLILSILDLFGGGAAQAASALALLVLVLAILAEGLPILTNLRTLLAGSASSGSSTGQPGVNPSNTPPKV
jgi:hypothetical protein